MRWTATLLLAVPLALAPAPAARAAGMIPEDSVLDLFLQVAGEAIYDDEIELNEQERFAALFLGGAIGLGGGVVRWEVEGNPDPTIDYTLGLENLSDGAQNVSFTILMPIVPMGAGSIATASLELEITSDGLGGAAFVVPLASAIQQSFVSEDGTGFTQLDVSVGLGTLAPGGSYSAGPTAAPPPDPMLGPLFTRLAVTGAFQISAGESATLTGNLTLVPEPGSALLFTAGLLAVWLFRPASPAGPTSANEGTAP